MTNDNKPEKGGAAKEGPIEINIRAILDARLPGKVRRFVPGFMVSSLENIIHQDELNEMLRLGYPAEGSAFARHLLNHLGIEVEVMGLRTLPAGKRYMFASNHPLGGLDGIALIAVLGEKYGDENVRFLVNDLLMAVVPLRTVFLPVNKFGAQGRSNAKAINDALASDKQMLQFPAGLVSRIQPDGSIRDLEWQKAFVSKALEFDRDIVPVRFEALNRPRFYRTAYWRKKLGIKVNLEQAMLPAELCAAKGARFRITFGTPVSIEAIRKSGKNPKETAAIIRDLVYRL